jgi:hypothetical protein
MLVSRTEERKQRLRIDNGDSSFRH